MKLAARAAVRLASDLRSPTIGRTHHEGREPPRGRSDRGARPRVPRSHRERSRQRSGRARGPVRERSRARERAASARGSARLARAVVAVVRRRDAPRDRRLPHPRAARAGRHGRRVPRRAEERRSARRAQARARRAARARQRARTLPARGAGGGAARSSGHRPRAHGRRARRSALPRHGVCRGLLARRDRERVVGTRALAAVGGRRARAARKQAAWRRRARAVERGVLRAWLDGDLRAHGAIARGSAPPRPPARSAAPGHQAVQRAAVSGWPRAAVRFRTGGARGLREAHGLRRPARHARLHGTGAVSRRECQGHARDRRVCARDHALRAARAAPPVREARRERGAHGRARR